VAIIALGGARFAVRAQCWRWCLLPGVPLDFRHAFAAFLAGDAVGNVTPLGMLASEPTKVLLTRHHLATLDSVASLALENILYTISVLAMLAFGLALMLATVPLSSAIRAPPSRTAPPRRHAGGRGSSGCAPRCRGSRSSTRRAWRASSRCNSGFTRLPCSRRSLPSSG
jgi:hypothetical protein